MSKEYHMHIPQTAADPTVMRIFPEVAEQIGLNKSIILLQIAFLIKRSKTYIDGEWWTWQSAKKLQQEYFPWWNKETVARALRSLEKDGLIISDNFNFNKWLKTKWYRLDIEKCKAEIAGLSWTSESVEPSRTRTTIIESVPLKLSRTTNCSDGGLQKVVIDDDSKLSCSTETTEQRPATETDDVPNSKKQKIVDELLEYGFDIKAEAEELLNKHDPDVVKAWIERGIENEVKSVPAFVRKQLEKSGGKMPRAVKKTVDYDSEEYRQRYLKGWGTDD